MSKMLPNFFCSVVVLATFASTAAANPLDPASFSSLGANPFTLAGAYTVNTSGATPILTLPNATVINGIIFGGIAVFTFTNIDFSSGVTLTGLQVAGSRPLALLSQGTFTLSLGATIDVSGGNGGDGINNSPTDGGAGGSGGNAGPGGGGGGGGVGGHRDLQITNGPAGVGGVGAVAGGAAVGVTIPGNGGSIVTGGGGMGGSNGAGGAYGGNGGTTHSSVDAQGGIAYGNPGTLQGGSGGGGGSGAGASGSGGGGGGGGAIEMGAGGAVLLLGNVLANGGQGGNGATSGDGGGGGGIMIHGNTVTLSGQLQANGGAGSVPVGGGGGGRVDFLTSSGTINNTGTISVAGGSHFVDSTPGFPGVVTVSQIPESSSMALLVAGLFGVLGARRRGALNGTNS